MEDDPRQLELMWIGQELVMVKVSSDIQNVKGTGPSTQGEDLQGLKPRSGTAPIMGLAESTKTEQRKTGLRLQDLFSLGVLHKIQKLNNEF